MLEGRSARAVKRRPRILRILALVQHTRTETQRDYAKRVLKVLIHIQTHLDEDLDLDGLARIACFSPFHFHRVFRGVVGEPVKEHVRRLRLERAALQLKSGELSVTEVAFRAGYEAHEAFTRAFRARFSESPSGFRRAHRSAAPTGVHYSPEGTVTGFEPLQLGEEEMQAEIATVDPMRVAFIRHIGPYHEVGPAWQRLFGWAGAKGLLGPQTRMFGMCHDDPDVTPPDKIRYDACIVVGDDVQAEGDIGIQDLPGGRYAKALHEGSYSKLGETYSALVGRWMPAHDFQPANDRPALEFYLNNPQQTPEDQLRTEIYMPLGST